MTRCDVFVEETIATILVSQGGWYNKSKSEAGCESKLSLYYPSLISDCRQL